MSARRRAGFAIALVIGVAACGKSKPAAPDAGASNVDAAPGTLLQAVAAIVIPKCAVAGCHDAVSKTHAMDLSTPEKIHSNWVDVRGFDHCTSMNTLRVIPGDPEASLVMLKVEGISVCLQSQRMPLPPREPLSDGEIDVIRAWIAAGAPSDGAPPADAGSEEDGSADASDDGVEADAGGGSDDDGGPLGCTSAFPCGPELTCEGLACGEPWTCISHFDETLEHPCAPETILWCGCDGVTFEASVTCPDRPWAHAGACGDGASCTEGAVRCSEPKPVCPEGHEAAVVNDCWGGCVPISACRCIAHWMCPNLARYTCLEGERCGPNPRLADGGTPTDGP